MSVESFTPVQQTALATLYARALDHRSPRSILGDRWADELVERLDFDFPGLGVTPSVVALVALRAKMLDDRIRHFVRTRPGAVVVDLGAGLGTGCLRVDPPPSVRWYSVDLPAVIAVREAVLPRRDHDQALAASVIDPHWPAALAAEAPTMFVADGLFPFLPDQMVRTLVVRIAEHFHSGVLAFNDYGSVSRLNRYAKLLTARRPMFRTMYGQWAFRGFGDAHTPQGWTPRLRLTEETTVFDQPEAELFPRPLRLAARVAAKVPAVARTARILCYEFPPVGG